MMTTLTTLPQDTIRLIGSTQVITSVSCVVKELIENSIDAGATNIQVKLENYGLDRIEVRDNGCGITEEDFPYFAKRHCTSKISKFRDLEELVTYGFRGEALASLCSVSDLTVTSRTSSSSLAQNVTFSKSGDVLKMTPASSNEGTTIIATGLFRKLPVRHQFSKNEKRCKEELKKVENLITAFGIINPAIRFTLRHNKETLSEKGAVDSYRSGLIVIWGWSLVQQLKHIVKVDDENQMSLEMFLPQPGSDVNFLSRTGGDQGLVFVNKRPVSYKAIQKVVHQYYCNMLDGDKNRHPLFVGIITVGNSEVDVNLEPNKARVLLHNEDKLLDILTSLLEQLYGVLGSGNYQMKEGPNHMSTKTKPRTENKVTHCSTEKTATYGIEPHSLGIIPHPQTKTPSVVTPSGNLLPTTTERYNSSSDRISLSKPAESSATPMLAVNPSVAATVQQTTAHHTALHQDTAQNTACPTIMHHNTAHTVHHDNTAVNNIVHHNTTAQIIQPNNIVHHVGSAHQNASISANICALDREEIFREFEKAFEMDTTVSGSNLERSLLPEPQRRADEGNTNPGPPLPLLPSGDGVVGGPLQLEDWSRGKVGALNGNILQPVRLLSPSSGHQTTLKPQSTSPLPHHLQVKKKPSLPRPNDQMRLYDLVGSQPIKRPVTAFNIFLNETRTKLLQGNADMTSDEIQKQISVQWKQLSELEKNNYEKLYEKDLKRYENQMNAAKKVALNKLKQKKLVPVATVPKPVTLNDEGEKRTPPKGQRVAFNIKTLKRKLYRDTHNKSLYDNNECVPVGHLPQSDHWVCLKGTQILLLNPHRVNEVVIYRRLLESFKFQAEPMDNPVDLSESLLGDVTVWQTLMSLETEQQGMLPSCQQVTDHRITDNGFNIVLYTGLSPKVSHVQLIGVANCIATYGVSDLCEVLENIAAAPKFSSPSLIQCRPLKILNYLKAEAVRMARKQPLFSSQEEIFELLQSGKCWKNSECLHKRPFFHEIYDINSLPYSQTILEDSHLT